jgi:hypothetical protein
VLTREAQERGELGQALQQTGDRRRVALAVAVSERLGAAARLIDRKLARVGGDVVEDLPERGLDLVLGVGGDPGEEIAGAVHQAALPQRLPEHHLDRADEPGCAVGAHQQRRPQAAGDQFAEEAGPGPWPRGRRVPVPAAPGCPEW